MPRAIGEIPGAQVAIKHFAMQPQEYTSTKLNWMLRLPQSAQLIGVVQVRGHRSSEGVEEGLIAAADREGFVGNAAFNQLFEVIRGAVEMLAVADRRLQLEADEAKRVADLNRSREETRQAIEENSGCTRYPQGSKAVLGRTPCR